MSTNIMIPHFTIIWRNCVIFPLSLVDINRLNITLVLLQMLCCWINTSGGLWLFGPKCRYNIIFHEARSWVILLLHSPGKWDLLAWLWFTLEDFLRSIWCSLFFMCWTNITLDWTSGVRRCFYLICNGGMEWHLYMYLRGGSSSIWVIAFAGNILIPCIVCDY